MGFTKRLLEAQQADFYRELRVCAGCGHTCESYDDAGQSWTFQHSILGPFVTFWACYDCKPRSRQRCMVCNTTTISSKGVPICLLCLTEYEAKVRSLLNEATCERCGENISPSEWDMYQATNLCGWCWKVASTPDVEVVGERHSVPDNRIITPEEFRTGTLIEIPTDIRLIRYLDSHPEALYALPPRKFEELVAELLSGFGYKVTLGKGSRDGGVDVFAERFSVTGMELALVQCKRNKPDNKVGEPIIKQLLADVDLRAATRGIAVTTSWFTRDALKLMDSKQYRLSSVDHDKLCAWLQAHAQQNRRTSVTPHTSY